MRLHIMLFLLVFIAASIHHHKPRMFEYMPATLLTIPVVQQLGITICAASFTAPK
ncbi:hypothetical protein [Roseivirga pacifica]